MESHLNDGGAREDAGADSTPALPPGARLGSYEVVAVLARGSASITYRARDAQSGRDVAIKEYLPAFALRRAGPQVAPGSEASTKAFRKGRDRFLKEAKALAGLKDVAGVVPVQEVLEENGTVYMVMPLLEGESLEARLQRDHRLSRLAVERIMTPLLDGLERAHEAGCLHRDIQPANILIDRTDHPTLIDFGRPRKASPTDTPVASAGTAPDYAAPEQSTSAQPGPWTDIYALGATLYRCVTGDAPPSATARLQRDTMVPATQAARGHYPPNLLAFIDAALFLNEADRPPSIAEWRRILAIPAPAKADRSTARPGAGARTGRSGRPPARTGWSMLVAIGLVGLSLAGGGAFMWQRAEDEAARKVAEEKAAAEAEARRLAEEVAARKAQETARAATSAWAEVQGSEDAGRLRAFAGQFPGTPEARLALQRADQLEAVARRRAEEEAARRAAEAERERARAAAAAWAELKDSEDPARLRAFAGQFPGTPEARLALDRAGQVEAAAKRRAEEEAARRAAEAERERARAAAAAWAEVKDSDDPARLRQFAAQFPRAPEAQLAMKRAAELEAAAKRRAEEEAARRQAEEARERARAATAAWPDVQDSNDPAQLQRFADQYPGTPEARLALDRADELKATQEQARRSSEREAGRSPAPPQGEGPRTVTYPDGSRYVGRIVNDKRNGQGTYTYANGDRYIGTWQNDEMHGRGLYLFRNGSRYQGDWRQGKKHGKGNLVDTSTGDRYEGDFVDDQKQGQGTYFWADGGRYEGAWRNQQQNGRGVRTWPNGDRYEGEWQNNRAHGQGVFRDAQGNVFNGRWQNGCFMDGDRPAAVGAPMAACER